MRFDFDIRKNEWLLEERSINFIKVIEIIAEKGYLLNIEHPNKQKYPHQRLIVLEYNNYTYCVPCVESGGCYFLKTVYPCRKFQFLIKKKEGSNE